MSADREKANRRNRERYHASAEIRQKRSETSHRYYLSHKQKWILYAKARRRRIQDQVKEQCGGMEL